MTLINHLVKSVRNAAVFNSEIEVAPACILWPDRDRQWEPAIPALQAELPELIVLGDYSPESKMGPAIWLRCALAGTLKDITLPHDRTPIVYLPGVSRQGLRPVGDCPDHLKPLAELQYRGVLWSQSNGKDWTLLSFMKSAHGGGLGLDISQDNETKNALQLALCRFLDEDLDLLLGKRLDKTYFNTLLTGGDSIRELLQWLDESYAFKVKRSENEWQAFIEVCKSKFAFDPERDGLLAGAVKLATHQGAWQGVWERFCEAPRRYPNIPDLIRRCELPSFELFTDEETTSGWPQWNESRENELRQDLLRLVNLPEHEAREKIIGFEREHGSRRKLVWADLGEAPLACALEHLAAVAEYSKDRLAAGSIDDLVAGYNSSGWKVDDYVLKALAEVESQADVEAVVSAVRSIYLPWAEASARYLQKVVDDVSYPGGNHTRVNSYVPQDGDCMLFVDGLRFDIGKRLTESLNASNFETIEEHHWAALPSVTATGKPAVTPVRHQIRGEDGNADFEPVVAATGESLKGGYHLKKLLAAAEWQILERSAVGNGKGFAWSEFSDIDKEGHNRGWKIASRIDALVADITGRIGALLDAGWKRVHVVTDHGWLLLPGGLPKTELSSALSDHKWGRCASLKSGLTTDDRLYPWYWNPTQYFVLADGISCFKNGAEYAHGGLSLQECLTSHITVTAKVASQAVLSIDITDVVWKGLRCTIATEGIFPGLLLDVRKHPGDPLSSVVLSVKPIKDDGAASVVVEDEDLEGQTAWVVVTDSGGLPVYQFETIIGRNQQ